MVFTHLLSLCTLAALSRGATELDFNSFSKRQVVNDDNQCSSLCTTVSTDARLQSSDGDLSYCNNQTWINQYNDCINCADGEDLPIVQDPARVLEQACSSLSSVTQRATVTKTTTSTLTSFPPSTITATISTSTANTAPTAVKGCHTDGGNLICYVDGDDYEWEVTSGIDNIKDAPDEFSSCRPDGDDGNELICILSDGSEVVLQREDGNNDNSSTTTASTNPTITSSQTATSSSSSAAPAATSDGAASGLRSNSASLFAVLIAAFTL